MIKKVAILGRTGMLGSMMWKVFSNETFDLVGTTRNELDAQNASVVDIEKLLYGCKYAINCIGIIKPYIHDYNSFEVERALQVNSIFPHKLAKASESTGTKVIQIATDCVFDGLKGEYTELDKHNATDVYGKTKSLGEIHHPNFLNLRCSIVGREINGKISLLEWFLNQPKNVEINGFLNHQWNGITTYAFSKICLGIINNDEFFSGLRHVVPADTMNKADILNTFSEVFDRQDIRINYINADNYANRTIKTIDIDTNNKLWNLANYPKPPTINEMIKEIKSI